MVVVGAGVIGIEYASMFAALGTKVTVVEKRPSMLDFCDKEIVEALQYQLRDLAVTFRFSESVREVQKHPAGTLTILESGKKIPADTVLYSAGRQGVTDELNVAAAGVTASNRGRIEVNEQLPDRGRTHLRRRRRHRLPGAGRHRDGTGPAGDLPRVRRAGRQQARRPAADRHLHHPRDQLRRPHRGAS